MPIRRFLLSFSEHILVGTVMVIKSGKIEKGRRQYCSTNSIILIRNSYQMYRTLNDHRNQ